MAAPLKVGFLKEFFSSYRTKYFLQGKYSSYRKKIIPIGKKVPKRRPIDFYKFPIGRLISYRAVF